MTGHEAERVHQLVARGMGSRGVEGLGLEN